MIVQIIDFPTKVEIMSFECNGEIPSYQKDQILFVEQQNNSNGMYSTVSAPDIKLTKYIINEVHHGVRQIFHKSSIVKISAYLSLELYVTKVE